MYPLNDKYEDKSNYNGISREISILKVETGDFPGGTVDKNPPANARDTGSILGLGRPHTSQSN